MTVIANAQDLFDPVKIHLILASASPRRRDLIKTLGITPEIIPSTKPEHPESTAPKDVVKELSRQKAESVAAEVLPDASGKITVVLGSDTVVAAGGRILGKPHSHEEAAKMIRMLSGNVHQVYTGVTMIRLPEGGSGLPAEPVTGDIAGPALQEAIAGGTAREITFAVCTDVEVFPMSEAEIRQYADSEEPMDKAGAYGIQGSFARYVKRIDGDYDSVVGLPVSMVYQKLKELV